MIGVPHRIGGLDVALKYVCSHNGGWEATGSEIVQASLASRSTFESPWAARQLMEMRASLTTRAHFTI